MEPTPLLELRGASVRLGDELVLDGVDFRLLPGEIHSLMGENGAGKSTLVKAITGALPLAAGVMTVDGRPCVFRNPLQAQRAGVSSVYQEIDLLPNLSVAENICLGREPRRFGMVDWPAMREHARRALDTLGVSLDVMSQLGTHSLAVQQLVAIARAVSTDLRVLVLDEPTSSLDADECAELFRVVRQLKARGAAVLFVSHFLEQVYELCDRVTVLRDGRCVGEYLTRELLRIDLVQAMVGDRRVARRLAPVLRVAGPQEPPYLSARGLVATGVHGADVDLLPGEVLGVAGLLGSGRSELARAMTGIDPVRGGVLRVRGDEASFPGPRPAIRLGVVYSSENRRTEGIISELSVAENITLALQAERGVLRRLPEARKRELAASWVEALDIRPADLDRPAGTLSGGNQQKVLLARLLALAPRVLVLDEPTRGIDVGSKVEVQNLVRELADNGVAVMFISVELDEVLRVGNRVAILQSGRVLETLAAEDLTVDSLTALVTGADGIDG
ncbi:sugar ABC transporter ATP-binding protein [Kineosporia sp. A_224]|uniref:sugar ABC transporter ATP-binding protein n=1 Tax=Kineosporia sp. A_224 TaxID=1962180 RepID=UPI000B4BD077|nr:sugar ABC transporter ATP-binding protein [Kineosporia sp. A_224]